MNHLTEEQLILHYYGEAAESGDTDVNEHLTACASCREEFRRLQLVLNTVSTADVPERSADYGDRVWNRLNLKTGWFSWFKSNLIRPWVLGPAAVAAIAIAFFAGQRFPSRAPVTTASAEKVRERILLVAVGDHLDRSQMVLAEISHASPDGSKFDISEEQRTAEDLLDANRLYRQTAQRTGDTAVAGVLDDLERVLIEIANGPNEVSAGHLAELQRRIHDEGLLFKVRVMGTQVRQRERTPASPEKTTSL